MVCGYDMVFVRLRLALWGLADRWCSRGAEASGPWGERWAARLLRARGCRILGRNVRPCRHGELDLVACHRGVILFVEVKTRRGEAYGRPLEAVGRRKREVLRRCATHWLAQARLLRAKTLYRFDAVEVIGRPGKGVPEMRWVRGLDMSGTRAPDLF